MKKLDVILLYVKILLVEKKLDVDLKKIINNICQELFAESIAISLYGEKNTVVDTEALLSSIMDINRNYVNRISHPEPGMPAKVYFKDLIDNFNKDTCEIIDQLFSIG